jgi:hypothetical protein
MKAAGLGPAAFSFIEMHQRQMPATTQRHAGFWRRKGRACGHHRQLGQSLLPPGQNLKLAGASGFGGQDLTRQAASCCLRHPPAAAAAIARWSVPACPDPTPDPTRPAPVRQIPVPRFAPEGGEIPLRKDTTVAGPEGPSRRNRPDPTPPPGSAPARGRSARPEKPGPACPTARADQAPPAPEDGPQTATPPNRRALGQGRRTRLATGERAWGGTDPESLGSCFNPPSHWHPLRADCPPRHERKVTRVVQIRSKIYSNGKHRAPTALKGPHDLDDRLCR